MKPPASPFIRILVYILRYKGIIAAAMLCSVMYAVMNGASAYLAAPFMKTLFTPEEMVSPQAGSRPENPNILDRAQDAIQGRIDGLLGAGTAIDVLARLCILIIVVILIKNVFNYIQRLMMVYVEQAVVQDIRQDIYNAYHRLPLRFFQKRKTGDLISRVINDCNTINTNLNTSLMDLMKNGINFTLLLGFMIIISWRLTIVTFLIAPPTLFIINFINRKLRRRTTRTQSRISDITSVLDETISNIRIVKAFAMEHFEIERFRKANGSYFRALLRFYRVRQLSGPVTEFLGVCIAVLVLWVGGSLVLDNKGLDPGDFVQFILLMFLLMQSAKSLSEVNVKIQVGLAATGRVFEIIDYDNELVDAPAPVAIDGIHEGIRLKGVSYEYEPGVPVLNDISLDVRAGESIAIVGPSGGGKSTLVDLLPRFFDPTAGSVELDGRDIREYRMEDVRRLFGIVTQETLLFHDTIRANIAYGRPDIPLDDIVSAARTANAHDFIMRLDDGYDTIIGDRGTKLSGGQRQRIVIARAILKNPPVLIFDEATSALDSEAESEVQAAMERLMKGRTAFVIAHRLSTVKKAARIVVIEQGRIVEMGTHDELYAHEGLYRRLSDLQFTDTAVNGL